MMSWGMINCIKENLYLVILGEITVLNNCSLGKNSEMNQRHTVGYVWLCVAIYGRKQTVKLYCRNSKIVLQRPRVGLSLS